jgi:hypothetical protein
VSIRRTGQVDHAARQHDPTTHTPSPRAGVKRTCWLARLTQTLAGGRQFAWLSVRGDDRQNVAALPYYCR